MKWRLLISLAGAGLLATACRKEAPPPPPAAVEPALPTHAQPPLRAVKLWLGAEEISAEVAITPEQIRAGMMFRTNLAENAGMLFLLPQPGRPSFWMKNCPLPLSAAFLNPGGVVLELHDFQPQNTNPVVATASNVQFVLEVGRGWFERHHIGPGTRVRTEYGSLLQTFSSGRRLGQ